MERQQPFLRLLSEGAKGIYWNVYPIAIDRHHIYIVCPWCREIHTHRNHNGDYEGHRVAHCFKDSEDNKHSGYVIQKIEDLKG